MKAMEVIAQGIKCDHPECDYRDPTVTKEQFQSYVNRPCPQCGSPLLTEADWSLMQLMQSFAAWISQLEGPSPEESRVTLLEIAMDGSGIPQFLDDSGNMTETQEGSTDENHSEDH